MRLTQTLFVGILALFGLSLFFSGIARADNFPTPSLYPLTPELKFTHGTPTRIVVTVPGENHPVAYWYMTYTVTNENDKPVRFLPQFDMLTDDGCLIRSDIAIPPQVFEQIKKREGNKLLESAKHIEGDIQPGEDQAKDGVAIWPEPMARMGRFSIFVGGLNSEYVTLKHVKGEWVPIDRKNAAEEIKNTPPNDLTTVRKTLQLMFHVAGDEVRPGDDEVHSKGQKWVMR